jgi:hypothetical protein
LVWLGIGIAIGAINGLTLSRTALALDPATPARAAVVAVGGVLLRLGLSGGLLVIALKQGIVAGLLAFAGLLVARWAWVIWVGGLRR